MPVAKLKEFLDSHRVKYVTIIHSPAYTSQEIAHSAHISGWELAKTVVVKMDGKFAMVVVPAPEKIDLELVMEAAGASKVSLATEEEFQGLFPECELGAMPPFGHLYGLPVFAAEDLARDEMIAFNAGSHSELIEMALDDYVRLAQPRFFKP